MNHTFFFIKKKTMKKKSIMIKFIKNIYVVDNLKINLLIKINILNSKKVVINFFKKSIIFIRCRNVFIFMQFTF